MAAIVLHQFPYSHFNDKVRWALSYKGIEHEKIGYLPGPHMPAIKKLSGQQQTPVLEIDGDVVAGTSAIIDRLERDYPTPALYPEDNVARKEALDFQARYDEVVGPATRTVLFAALINEGAYMCGMFSTGKPALTKFLYRMTFPLARGLIAKGNGINEENILKAQKISADALDEVVQKTEKTGYIVGDSFTIADLTAAALFAPLANPQHKDMARPEPIPASVTEILDRYKPHPAIAWVNRQYQLHRP